ncbi:ABC transporter ATP-binding protein [Ramlibacter sp. AW1]|uniref:ABC transporter ATP-binding protein n=1 Tax=Ramlibacter aurantiacus TaxID=2801330 RepID=A0A936ZQL6_9BURK|nr:ABC transporter ATP-binding protein [Ramlibacter aurantiacus]MBL0421906.1 ABC transporter ATP-binding protein [Ramlibacter aurantiacus]
MRRELEASRIPAQAAGAGVDEVPLAPLGAARAHLHPRVPHVSLEGVSRVFGTEGSAGAVVAVDDVHIDAYPGEFLTIVGPSGCGKSTVLNLLAGLDQPTRGRIRIHGEEAGERRGRFGYMFQKDLLLPWRTIVENVALGLEVHGVSGSAARAKALALLQRFELAAFADKYPSQLSGGMRQRVALMRTLVLDTDCLLLDEPFGALDALTRSVMQAWLLGIWEKEHRTVVFITHDIEEAVFLSDRVLTMSARPGRIKGEFTIDLPRPRHREMLTSDAFVRLKKDILEQIYDDSLRAEQMADRP